METGMDVGQNVSTIGDMAVFAGAVSAQPSFIVGGALAGAAICQFATRSMRKIPFTHKIVNRISRTFTDKKVGAFSK